MNWQLTVQKGPDTGQTFVIEGNGSLSVGRADDCDISLNDPRVSRMQFTLQCSEQNLRFLDGGSTYGTQVNSETIQECALQEGDLINAGDTQILVDAIKTPGFTPATAEHSTIVRAKKVVGAKSRLGHLSGTQLQRYHIGQPIAEGETGQIFGAFDVEKDRPIALKILWPEIAQREDDVQRFVRAIKTMMPIQHPNLVRLYGAGVSDGYCWVAMEMIEGESLADVIKRLGVGGMLDWESGFRVARDIGRALERAFEEKIVHRNITPQNIMIRSEDGVAKLGDLMLAKALEGTQAVSITKPGQIVGNIAYLSPEQASGTGEIDCRSDIYNLGATVYHLLAGHPPVGGTTPIEMLKNIANAEPKKPREAQLAIPEMFENVIMTMLAKAPEKRYQNPSQLLLELDRVAKFHGIDD